MGARDLSGGERNVVKLDCGDSSANLLKNAQDGVVHSDTGRFRVCTLYLRKAAAKPRNSTAAHPEAPMAPLGSPLPPAHLCWERQEKPTGPQPAPLERLARPCGRSRGGWWPSQESLDKPLAHRGPADDGREFWGGGAGAREVISLCTGRSEEPAPRSHSGGLGRTARLALTHEGQRRRECGPTGGSGCAVHRKTEKAAHVQQRRESCPDKTPWKYSAKVKRVTGQPATWKRRRAEERTFRERHEDYRTDQQAGCQRGWKWELVS